MKPRPEISLGEKLRKSPDLTKTVGALVLQCRNPAALLELHYWSQDRDLPAIMRAIAGMTPLARATLLGFLGRAAIAGTDHITAVAEADERLVLRCPEIPDHFAGMTELLQGEHAMHRRRRVGLSRKLRRSGNVIPLAPRRGRKDIGKTHGRQKARPG